MKPLVLPALKRYDLGAPKYHGIALLIEVIVLTITIAPVAQRYHVTSDTLGREFDPGKRDFSH